MLPLSEAGIDPVPVVYIEMFFPKTGEVCVEIVTTVLLCGNEEDRPVPFLFPSAEDER